MHVYYRTLIPCMSQFFLPLYHTDREIAPLLSGSEQSFHPCGIGWRQRRDGWLAVIHSWVVADLLIEGIQGAHNRGVPVADGSRELGKAIAFLDNNKLQPHNRYFDLLGHLLQEREGARDIIHAKKPFFTRPAREEVLKPLMTQADAVVTGVGE